MYRSTCPTRPAPSAHRRPGRSTREPPLNATPRPAQVPRTAVIIGGGIGGLASAIALARSAWQVTVLEQAPVYWSAGAGIIVTANGNRALQDLGVARTVRRHAQALRFTGIRDLSGRQLLAPRAPGSLTWAVHRQALHAALLDAAATHAEIRLGARVTGVDVGRRDGGSARLSWVDVEGEHRSEADLIVGAEGARDSLTASVRRGASSGPSGFAAWRAVIEDADLIGSAWTTWWGRGLEFSAIRIGPQTVSWHALFRTAPGQDSAHHILENLSGWPNPAAQRAAATPAAGMFRHDLPILDATPTGFSRGRAVLVGDAAHPLLPTAHQGANLAVEDAVTLGRLLAPGVGLDQGLRAYDRHRIPRVSRVDRLARRLARLGVGCPEGLAQRVRDRALGGLPGRWLERSLASLPAWAGPPSTTDRIPRLLRA
ncbi:MAG: FAD-dependent oxidoreductase [Propioniciclava sp.]